MQKYECMSVAELKKALVANDIKFNNAKPGSAEEKEAREFDEYIVGLIKNRLRKKIPYRTFVCTSVIDEDSWNLSELLCDFLDDDSVDIKSFIESQIKNKYPDNIIEFRW